MLLLLLLLTLSWLSLLLSSLPLMAVALLLARPRVLGASINRGLRGERVLARDQISTPATPRALSLCVPLSVCPRLDPLATPRASIHGHPSADEQRCNAEIP